MSERQAIRVSGCVTESAGIAPGFSGSRMNGASLIELMIASVLSVIIISGVLTLYANSQHTSRTQNYTRQIQENGRFALQIMGEDVRMAQYYGINLLPSTIDTSYTSSLSYGCGGTGWATNVVQSVFAANNSNPYSGNCISGSNYVLNSDVLVVRHAESDPLDDSEIEEDHLYLYTSLTDGETFRAIADDTVNASTLNRVTETPASTYKFSSNVYYIRPCSDMSAGDSTICDGGDDDIPTLVRETLAANDTIAEPLVKYVENMQLTFGVDLSSPADFTVDRYVSAAGVSDWGSVLSTKIDLLLRSPEAVSGYTNSNTYLLGDQAVSPADGYPRKVFTTTLFIRNPSLDISI